MPTPKRLGDWHMSLAFFTSLINFPRALLRSLFCLKSEVMPEGKKPPRPGPARLTKNADVDEWLKCAFNNQYLPETTMKKLCEICKELLMEGKHSESLL